MDAAPEPAFAWYRLEGREAASLLVIALFALGMCGAVIFTRPDPQPLPVSGTTPTAAVVHVNRAGVAELSSLPGIGERKAERIVEARKAAPITSMDELAKAAGGIPHASRERMTPFVKFD